MERLTADPVFLATQWNAYARTKPRYFQYINDVEMPSFINERHAREFIGQTSLQRPISDLTQLWNMAGLVHGSLTSLSHATEEPIAVTWGPQASDGVVDHHSFARSFNQRILYPNLAVSGLRDLDHVCTVDKPVQDPSLLKQGGALSLREGYGVYCRSIAEVLIVATHGALLKGSRHRSIIAATMLEAMAGLVESAGHAPEMLRTSWANERLSDMLADVEEAMDSGTLRLSRFVRTAELYILALEGPSSPT